METRLKKGSSLIDPALDIRLSVRVIPYGQVLQQKGQTLSSFTTWILAIDFLKSVFFWIFLLIRLGLELGLRLGLGVKVGTGFGLVYIACILTPLLSSENDVRSVCWMENSANPDPRYRGFGVRVRVVSSCLLVFTVVCNSIIPFLFSCNRQ